MLSGYLQDNTDIFRTLSIMQSNPNKLATALVAIVCALLLAACTAPGALLKVKPQKDAGIQYSPQEISRMMDIMGYERLLTPDPDTGRSVAIATNDGQYRMRFQFRENTSIQVKVHIVIGNGAIGLHIYQPGSKVLDSAATQQYDNLKQRLILQYGADYVSDSNPVFAP